MRTGRALGDKVARSHVHDALRIMYSTGSFELLQVAPDSNSKRELVIVILQILVPETDKRY
jgi:hypothetical protein